MIKIAILCLTILLATCAPSGDKMDVIPVPLHSFRDIPKPTIPVYTLAILILPAPTDHFTMCL